MFGACFCALAQSGPKLEFEVASVKPAAPAQLSPGMLFGCQGGPGTSDPGLFSCKLNLKNLIVRLWSDLLSGLWVTDTPAPPP